MKIYTKTGDDGSTGLFGAGRVMKNDPRLRAYGAVDEANSCLGLAIASMSDTLETVTDVLLTVQGDLFVVGADLATPLDARAMVPRIDEKYIQRLEKLIDEYTDAVPDLKTFILPGGSAAAAYLHQCRTVTRRSEREVVEAAESHELNPLVTMYLNRLSDLLFQMARFANVKLNIEDTPWVPPKDEV